MAAAVNEAEDVVLGDFLAEANAARTEDAAFVVERDAGAELGALGFDVFLFDEARVAASVAGGLFLEFAFAGLVADGAVEGVVDEEKFHDAFAGVAHHLRCSANVETGGGVGAAADLGAGHPVDFLFAGGGSMMGVLVAGSTAGGPFQ